MTHVVGLLLALILGLAGFGGCTSTEEGAPLDPGPPANRVGSLLTSWSEANVPGLQENPELAAGSQLIATEIARDRLLASEPLGADLAAVAAVDLEASVLVVGGYHACQELGGVWSDGSTVWFDAVVPPNREGIDCAWSPFTVVIFEVPRDAFGAELELVTPPWKDQA